MILRLVAPLMPLHSNKTFNDCVLPDEILDNVFQELLPDASSFFTQFQSFPVPSDLMRCRLACHLFNRLATPWVWRRLQLRLSHNAHSEHDLVGPLPFIRPWNSKMRKNIKHSRDRVVEICTFLVKHPELSRNIRLFSLKASLPINLDYNVLSSAFSALLSIMPLLTSIRILCLELPRGCARLVPLEICVGLLSRPSLHVVKFLRNEALELCPSILKTMRNIKQLVIGGVCYDQSKELLYSLMPSVEVVQGALSKKMPHQLPWSNLKDVERVGRISCHLAMDDVVDNVLSRKLRRGSTASPVVEIQVIDPAPIRLEIFVIAYQLLTKLPLILVPDINVSLFERLFSAFPALEELTLIDNVYLKYLPSQEVQVLRPEESLALNAWRHIETGIVTTRSSWDEVAQLGYAQTALLPAPSSNNFIRVNCSILKPKASFQLCEFRVIRGTRGEIRSSGPIYSHWDENTSIWSNTQFITRCR